MLEARAHSALNQAISALADGLSPPEVELPFEPQEGPQQRLLDCDADEIFYGGARGGGKSFGFLLDWAAHAIQWGPMAKGLIIRRQFVDMEDLIEESHKIFPAIGGTWVAGRASWRFANGALLRMRHLDRDRDAEKYKGPSYTWIGIEEADTFAKFDTLKRLKGCLRSAAGVKVRFVLNANPGGVGHNWLKARYIDPAPPNTMIVETDKDTGLLWSRIYIPAKLEDNRILMENDPGYIARLRQIGPEWLVKAWVEGLWDIVAGGMFDDIFMNGGRERIIVPSLQLPPHLAIFRSFDWGSARPFSCGWWIKSDGVPMRTVEGREVVFPRGSRIRIAEWYGCHPNREDKANTGVGLLAQEVARGIIERERAMFNGNAIGGGVADSAMWIGTGTSGARSIADEMQDEGVWFNPSEKSPGSRRSGWEIMRRMLKAAAEGRDEPGLYVCENCRDWIRTVPALPRDKTVIDDVDTNAEDHAGDETRYFLTTPSTSFTMEPWRI